MRFLQGDLSVLSLANLLQALVLNRSSGVLTLEAGLERRVLRVCPTGIRLVRGSQRCHRFERLLRGLRNVPEGPPAEETPAPFTSPEATTRLMSEWMLEEICELLTWARGTFRFHAEFDNAVQYLNEGLIDGKPVITRIMPFESAVEAFKLAGDKSRSSKVLIAFDPALMA